MATLMPFWEDLHKMEANIKSDLLLQEAFEIISLFVYGKRKGKFLSCMERILGDQESSQRITAPDSFP